MADASSNEKWFMILLIAFYSRRDTFVFPKVILSLQQFPNFLKALIMKYLRQSVLRAMQIFVIEKE